MTRTGLTILLVDDDLIYLDVATDALRFLGYDVVSATTGESALAKLQEGGIDLLLTDANLTPSMDGFALATAARAAHPDLPVMYQSGDTALSRLPATAPEGVFIGKPSPLEQLTEAIQSSIGKGIA